MRKAPLTNQTGDRKNGLRTMRKVAPYLWPQDQPSIKLRVVLALLALLLARLVGVSTPFFYKAAVDALAPVASETSPVMMLSLGAVGLTVAYGVLRLASVGLNQLRDAIFARVGQRALRKLALETFQHMHALSLRYHITRKTGGAEPHYRTWRQGCGVPVAVHAAVHRAAGSGTVDGLDHLVPSV